MGVTEIIIPKRSTEPVRAIYSPDTAALMGKLGTPDVRRASNVEPSHELSDEAIQWLDTNANIWAKADRQPLLRPGEAEALRRTLDPAAWWADLIRSGGPVLGPFGTRDEGITAELTWLKDHNYPTCRACAEGAATVNDASRPRIQIEPPTTPVVLPDGSELIQQKDGSILCQSPSDGARSPKMEFRSPGEPGFEDWHKLFAADNLPR